MYAFNWALTAFRSESYIGSATALPDIGVENDIHDPVETQWIFATAFIIFMLEFDDPFDKPCCSLENISKLSTEKRALLVALSRHGLSGLHGDLEDWPVEVPGREAYLWLLKEAEDLREGAGFLIHYTFLDYCFGVYMEIMEWAPDVHVYRGDTTAWSLCRCNHIRKRSAGLPVALAGPLYITNKWMKKEHFSTCNDLLYDAGIIVALGNDIVGFKKDQKEKTLSLGLQTTKVASVSEIVQHHNENVQSLNRKILEMNGDIRRFMEEIEISLAGSFCGSAIPSTTSLKLKMSSVYAYHLIIIIVRCYPL